MPCQLHRHVGHPQGPHHTAWHCSGQHTASDTRASTLTGPGLCTPLAEELWQASGVGHGEGAPLVGAPAEEAGQAGEWRAGGLLGGCAAVCMHGRAAGLQAGRRCACHAARVCSCQQQYCTQARMPHRCITVSSLSILGSACTRTGRMWPRHTSGAAAARLTHAAMPHMCAAGGRQRQAVASGPGRQACGVRWCEAVWCGVR